MFSRARARAAARIAPAWAWSAPQQRWLRGTTDLRSLAGQAADRRLVVVAEDDVLDAAVEEPDPGAPGPMRGRDLGQADRPARPAAAAAGGPRTPGPWPGGDAGARSGGPALEARSTGRAGGRRPGRARPAGWAGATRTRSGARRRRDQAPGRWRSISTFAASIEVPVPDPGRTGGLARPAVEAAREMHGDGIGEGQAAVGEGLDEKMPPAGGVRLLTQLGVGRAGRQAEAAVDAGQQLVVGELGEGARLAAMGQVRGRPGVSAAGVTSQAPDEAPGIEDTPRIQPGLDGSHQARRPGRADPRRRAPPSPRGALASASGGHRRARARSRSVARRLDCRGPRPARRAVPVRPRSTRVAIPAPGVGARAEPQTRALAPPPPPRPGIRRARRAGRPASATATGVAEAAPRSRTAARVRAAGGPSRCRIVGSPHRAEDPRRLVAPATRPWPGARRSRPVPRRGAGRSPAAAAAPDPSSSTTRGSSGAARSRAAPAAAWSRSPNVATTTASASGRGRSLSVTSTMTPSVPSAPM